MISDLKKTISLLLKNHDLYFGISNISNRLNVLISRPVHLVVASSAATRKGWMPLGRFGRKGSRKEGRREGRKKGRKEGSSMYAHVCNCKMERMIVCLTGLFIRT